MLNYITPGNVRYNLHAARKYKVHVDQKARVIGALSQSLLVGGRHTITVTAAYLIYLVN
jgi:hypothetical protein